jgi:hypothetical protein
MASSTLPGGSRRTTGTKGSVLRTTAAATWAWPSWTPPHASPVPVDPHADSCFCEDAGQVRDTCRRVLPRLPGATGRPGARGLVLPEEHEVLVGVSGRYRPGCFLRTSWSGSGGAGATVGGSRPAAIICGWWPTTWGGRAPRPAAWRSMLAAERRRFLASVGRRSTNHALERRDPQRPVPDPAGRGRPIRDRPAG